MDRRLRKTKVLYRPVFQSERAVEQDQSPNKRTFAPPDWAEQQSRKACNHADKSIVGKSVNAVHGEVILAQVDFILPGRIPLTWTRNYGSQIEYEGVLGKGWQTPADIRLEVDAKGLITFYDGKPGGTVFGALPSKGPVMAASDGAMLTAMRDQYLVRLKSGMTYHFSKAIEKDRTPVVAIGDSNGNVLTFVRDDKGTLTRICTSGGQRIEVTSDEGRIQAMRLGDRQLVRYRYDNQQVIAALDAMGRPKRYVYKNRCLTRHTDINQLSFYYEYDDNDRCIHAWGDGGLYGCRLDHRPCERCVVVTDSLGHQTTYTYDNDRLPIKVQDTAGATTRYEYDGVGRITSITDPLERVTRYTYDPVGNVVEINRSDESRIQIVYDVNHLPVQMCDANGGIWEQRFDERGRLIEKIDPLKASTRYHYDTQGDLSAITDPEGHTTAFEYDNSGLIAAVIDPLNRTTRFQRDLLGNITAAIDAEGKATRFVYNDTSDLIQSALTSGFTQQYIWDGEGNVLDYTGTDGLRTRFEHGGLNKIIRRFNADGTTVSHTYDTEENLTGVTNENGEIHHLSYDHAGRVIARTDCYGQTTRYTYDAAGQLIRSVDPMDRVVCYDYDAAGRLQIKTLENEEQEFFHWDANGNLTGVQSPGATVERYCDAANRLTAEKSGTFVVEYQYDRTGRRIGRTSSHGNTVRYDYDQSGAVSFIRINDHAPVTIQRDNLGRIIHEQLSEKLKREFGYNEAGLLVRQLVCDNTSQMERIYDYDPAGNLIAKTDSQKGGWQFDYDNMGRMMEARSPEGRVRRFGYDLAGNLLDHLPLIGRRLRSARYNQTEYRFDAAGNLTERLNDDGLSRFSWDAQNRLISAQTHNDVRVDMTYDALGRRCIKAVSGERTVFHWDGDALLSEQSEDGPAREYVYYPGTVEPLAIIDGDGSLYYYHNDVSDLPQELTKPFGEIIWSAAYDALGRLDQILVEEVAQPLRMQGQYWDPEIELCYDGYRYFDPKICSFISQAPLGLAAGEIVYAAAPNVRNGSTLRAYAKMQASADNSRPETGALLNFTKGSWPGPNDLMSLAQHKIGQGRTIRI